MPTGTVIFWREDRGFGFIRPDAAAAADVFVHVSAFASAGLPAPVEGQRFAFEVEISPRSGKPAATNIRADAAT